VRTITRIGLAALGPGLGAIDGWRPALVVLAAGVVTLATGLFSAAVVAVFMRDERPFRRLLKLIRVLQGR